ncbi:unnamed protein product [Caenorhabditis auriculariae]|uniref:Uncharacterized protein n=1 Tax=Caenorhabditis auriculariae TaxID=2777116 RepID=A0A8S1HNP5_9PELO|nr:unnamed protein product [Caenorhabditis auriculariae]
MGTAWQFILDDQEVARNFWIEKSNIVNSHDFSANPATPLRFFESSLYPGMRSGDYILPIISLLFDIQLNLRDYFNRFE